MCCVLCWLHIYTIKHTFFFSFVFSSSSSLLSLSISGFVDLLVDAPIYVFRVCVLISFSFLIYVCMYECVYLCFVYRFWCSAVGRSVVRRSHCKHIYLLLVFMHVFILSFDFVWQHNNKFHFNPNYRHFFGCIGFEFRFQRCVCVLCMD